MVDGALVHVVVEGQLVAQLLLRQGRLAAKAIGAHQPLGAIVGVRGHVDNGKPLLQRLARRQFAAEVETPHTKGRPPAETVALEDRGLVRLVLSDLDGGARRPPAPGIQRPAQHLLKEEAVARRGEDGETRIAVLRDGQAGKLVKGVEPEVGVLLAKAGVGHLGLEQAVLPVHHPPQAPGGVGAQRRGVGHDKTAEAMEIARYLRIVAMRRAHGCSCAVVMEPSSPRRSAVPTRWRARARRRAVGPRSQGRRTPPGQPPAGRPCGPAPCRSFPPPSQRS